MHLHSQTCLVTVWSLWKLYPQCSGIIQMCQLGLFPFTTLEPCDHQFWKHFSFLWYISALCFPSLYRLPRCQIIYFLGVFVNAFFPSNVVFLISKNYFLFWLLEHPVLFHWQNTDSYFSEAIRYVFWGFFCLQLSAVSSDISLSLLVLASTLHVGNLLKTGSDPCCPSLFLSESSGNSLWWRNRPVLWLLWWLREATYTSTWDVSISWFCPWLHRCNRWGKLREGAGALSGPFFATS